MSELVSEGRRERRKRELRDRIWDVAQKLFLAQGFERTTVEQIAEAADIAPATFFNHFQTKNGLLGEMTTQVVSYLQGILEQQFEAASSAQERLTGFAAYAAREIAETRGLARDVLLELLRDESRPGDPPPYLARVHEPFAAMLREGQERGEVRANQDASFLAEMVVGVLNAAVTNWLADADYPIEERLCEAADFAWEAIRADRASARSTTTPEPAG